MSEKNKKSAAAKADSQKSLPGMRTPILKIPNVNGTFRKIASKSISFLDYYAFLLNNLHFNPFLTLS